MFAIGFHELVYDAHGHLQNFMCVHMHTFDTIGHTKIGSVSVVSRQFKDTDRKKTIINACLRSYKHANVHLNFNV